MYQQTLIYFSRASLKVNAFFRRKIACIFNLKYRHPRCWDILHMVSPNEFGQVVTVGAYKFY